jgi:hypothetical protein
MTPESMSKMKLEQYPIGAYCNISEYLSYELRLYIFLLTQTTFICYLNTVWYDWCNTKFTYFLYFCQNK